MVRCKCIKIVFSIQITLYRTKLPPCKIVTFSHEIGLTGSRVSFATRHRALTTVRCLDTYRHWPQHPLTAISHLVLLQHCKKGVDGAKIVLWSVTCVDLHTVPSPSSLLHKTPVGWDNRPWGTNETLGIELVGFASVLCGILSSGFCGAC